MGPGRLFSVISGMLTILSPTVNLPFPLTLGFKSMLQRGIETPNMDVRWVSSLSWYFLNFFGLNGLTQMIIGRDNSQCILYYNLCYVR